MSDAERYERQEKLREVGPEGQTRLSAARLTLNNDEGALVASAYLIRAGVESITLSRYASAEGWPHASAFRFAAARRYGAGAWRALEAVRRTLGMDP